MADSQEVAANRRPARACPECGQGTIYRSHRRTLEDYLLSLVALRPYRCHECNRRFHAWGNRRPRPRRLPWAQCPKCTSTEIERITRRKVPIHWNNLRFHLLGASAYRCPDCRKRFLDFRPRKPTPESPPGPILSSVK